ncbi:hypothetical protein SAMN06297129_2436 [Pseudooceanicola antarcticus]|nr:hypothetical protein [Pseudooceanicola antarcticus]SNY52899.1 hypothetical protein SAMN06297129_2436 [Pseudooceanicola antarcticus]
MIRIGHAAGIDNATIARALGRTKAAVGTHVRRMIKDETIGNLPTCYAADKLAEMLRREGGRK